MEETGILKTGTAAVAEHYHRGTNQSGMRDYNERLTLSLVRRHGSLSKTEIARLTKLSAQTVSVIMRELEDEGLLLRNEPIRGKIGQPSIPMSLNPEGAFFLGLKIGRRSAELVLIDFLGSVRAMLQLSYRYPTPRETVEFVSRRHQAHPRRADAGAGRAHRRARHRHAVRAVELGRRRRGAPREVMEHWRNRDIRADIQAQVTFPGLSAERRDIGLRRRTGVRQRRHAARLHLFLYRRLRRRRHRARMAGSMAARPAMPARSARCRFPAPDGAPRQLIDIASIAMLEKALNAKRPRRLATVDLAAGLGRPRRGARPMDRLGRQRPRLRDRRGIRR